MYICIYIHASHKTPHQQLHMVSYFLIKNVVHDGIPKPLRQQTAVLMSLHASHEHSASTTLCDFPIKTVVHDRIQTNLLKSSLKGTEECRVPEHNTLSAITRHIYIYMYICIFVYMYVYVYICIYVYVYICIIHYPVSIFHYPLSIIYYPLSIIQ